MIKKEDIKVGSVFQIRKVDLKDITDMSFIHQIDPNDIYDTFSIKVAGIENERCEIELAECAYVSIVADIDKLAKVSVFVNESANRKVEQVSHPSHYAWLKDLCGVEPIEICQHFDFSVGNALKYIMRKGKVERNLTEKQQRIQDLEKAIYYLKNEIYLMKNDSNNKDNK